MMAQGGMGNGMGSIEELAQKMKALAGNMQQPEMGGNAMPVGGPPGRSAFKPGAGGPFSGGGIGAPGTVNPETGTPKQWEPLPPASSTPMMGNQGQAGSSSGGVPGEFVQVSDANGMVKQIPKAMHEKWSYGDPATRAKIEAMNPVNGR